jgi:hypothetical protein
MAGDIKSSDRKTKLIDRSGLFVLAAQLEGLCIALRHVVPTGLQPGKSSIDLLKKLYSDFASISTGSCIEGFPKPDDSLSPFDLLVIAETLRSTVMAFLTPEEAEEHGKTFGFSKSF